MGRLINVSNRVPLAKTAAPGGLAVGVLAAMRARGGLWFGWNGETTTGQEPGEPDEPRDIPSRSRHPCPSSRRMS